jgi:ankyrin repeat protein
VKPYVSWTHKIWSLFTFCLPLEHEFRGILEYLLVSLSNISIENIQNVLTNFVRRTFSMSVCDVVHLDKDLCFLSNINNRHSFDQVNRWHSVSRCHYACLCLIESKANIYERNDWALRCASCRGFTEIVTLLLNNKANVHADEDFAIRVAIMKDHKDIVALLLEHKANIHSEKNYPVKSLSREVLDAIQIYLLSTDIITGQSLAYELM